MVSNEVLILASMPLSLQFPVQIVDPIVGPWCTGYKEFHCIPMLFVVVPVEFFPLVVALRVCKRIYVFQSNLS